jgi:hypothetical protein
MDRKRREILELLNYIASQKRTLKLITNFRGVPINITADIIRSSQTTGNVRLRVHHRQIVSLKNVRKILIQSDLFPSMLSADIEELDLQKAIITLQDLRYVTGSVGNRKNMRVQPESPIHVEVIMGHGYSVPGEIIDISLEGLSVRLTKDHFPPDDIYILETPVEIRLGLPATDKATIHDINVRARIIYTNENQQAYRIGLLTFMKEPDLRILRRYIFDRQTEILDEIQQMNRALLEAV